MSTIPLSKEELATLGVEVVETDYGSNIYVIPCCVCGMPVRKHRFSPKQAYKCEVCKHDLAKARAKMNKAAKREVEQALADAFGVDREHLHRFETAAAKFGEQYNKSIGIARKAIEKFDSMPEVMACIELLYIGARVIVHQKVGDFTVDFCLPDEKVAVEVDGSIYHSDFDETARRDYALKHMLGEGWTIRHVPADAVSKKHAQFGIAMRSMLNARRREAGLDRLRLRK